MSRPDIDPAALQSNQQAWDALLRDMLAAIVKAPFPVHQVADAASRPAAASYERCLVCTIDTNKLWFSNGTDWLEVTLT